MVKRGARPSWHLALTGALLVVAAAAVLFLHWRSRPAPEQHFGGRPIPTRPAAFADSLATGIERALAEVGVWLELIEVRRRDGGLAGDRLDVRVPGDLPLPMANVAVTGLVRRLDGRILQGAEVDGHIVLYCGPAQPLRGLTPPDSTWPAGATTRVELRRDRSLRRRTGRIAIVLDSLGGAAADAEFLDRLLTLSHPLTLHLRPEQARSSQFAERLIEAGHQVVLGSPPPYAYAEPSAYPAAGTGEGALPGDLVIDEAGDRPGAEDQLWELAFRAADQGQAVGIGRGRESTLQALEAVLPRLEMRGFELVTLSELAR